jgi:hypothetical protein
MATNNQYHNLKKYVERACSSAHLESVVVDEKHPLDFREVASQGLNRVPGFARGGLVLRGGVLGVAAVQNDAGVVEQGFSRARRSLQQRDDLFDRRGRGAGVNAQPEYSL